MTLLKIKSQDTKKGDEFDVNVTFPAEYHAESLKGKPALFKVKVIQLREKEEAELNDDLAKELGFDSVEDMTAKTRENITKEKKQELKMNSRTKLLTL